MPRAMSTPRLASARLMPPLGPRDQCLDILCERAVLRCDARGAFARAASAARSSSSDNAWVGFSPSGFCARRKTSAWKSKNPRARLAAPRAAGLSRLRTLANHRSARSYWPSQKSASAARHCKIGSWGAWPSAVSKFSKACAQSARRIAISPSTCQARTRLGSK